MTSQEKLRRACPEFYDHSAEIGGFLYCRSQKTQQVAFQKERVIRSFCDGSADIVLDSNPQSLQWQILHYLEKRKLIRRPRKMLQEAFERSKAVDASQALLNYVGSDGREKTTQDIRKSFTAIEQLLCFQAALSGKIDFPFQLKEFARLVEKSFDQGNGETLMAFLSLLWVSAQKRKARSKFNPEIVVLAGLWTSAEYPLWLLRTRAISEIVRRILDRAIAPQAIDATIRRAGLPRMKNDVLSQLYTRNIDSEGQKLLAHIEKELDIRLDGGFSGRPKAS